MTEGARMLLRSVLFLVLVVVVGVAGMTVFALVEREMHPAVAAGTAGSGGAPAVSPDKPLYAPRAFGNTNRGLVEFFKTLRPHTPPAEKPGAAPSDDARAAARP